MTDVRLRPGDPVPAFRLLNQHRKEVSPSDFLGKRLVVFFYPLALTMG